MIMISSEHRGNDRAFPACVTNLRDLTQCDHSHDTTTAEASPWSCSSMTVKNSAAGAFCHQKRISYGSVGWRVRTACSRMHSFHTSRIGPGVGNSASVAGAKAQVRLILQVCGSR